jgi:hypothetical protein
MIPFTYSRAADPAAAIRDAAQAGARATWAAAPTWST